MNQTINVVAIVHSQTESIGTFSEAVRACIEPSLGEDGCISYAAFRDMQTSNRFVFVEQWESEEALKAHEASPHFQRMIEALTPIMKSGFEVMVIKPV